MFLTKKNNPQTKQKPKNSKALGGWDDDQPDQITTTQINKPNNTAFSKSNFQNNTNNKIQNKTKITSNMDLLNDDEVTIVKSQYQNIEVQNATLRVQNKNGKNKSNQTSNLYRAQQLSEMANIECECKIVENVIAPGGIRVKQTDAMLIQFQNQAKNLNIPIIGSILIAYLHKQNISFQTKARALYAIEYLSKKNIQYSVYFKMHVNQIKDSSNSQEQVENYIKIKKSVLGSLGALIIKPQQRKQLQQQLSSKQGINFVDPGYNIGEDGPRSLNNLAKKVSQKSQKQKTKKFISPLQAKNKDKKVLEGPKKAQNAIKKQNNIQVDLLQINNNNNTKKIDNLIDFIVKGQSQDLLGQIKQKQVSQKPISFQQLLQSQKRKKSKQFDFTI